MSPRFRYTHVYIIGFVLMVLGVIGLRKNVSAYTGEVITLTKVGERTENLDSVHGVQISYQDDLSLKTLLKDCTNLEYLKINRATIDDLTFINEITPENGFELVISMGYYDFNGMSNPAVKSLWVSASYVKNFATGMDFPNVESLRFEHVSGYEDIDYSNYPFLRDLNLVGEAVSDYQAFFEQLASLENLTSLGLSYSNITDADTAYLETLHNITNLSLEGTHVADLSFLADMPQIEILRPSLDAEDLSVIKQLPNLRVFYWIGTEQLTVDDELYQYIEDHEISHFKYEPTLKAKIEQMAAEIEVSDDMTVKEKVEAVVDYVTEFITSHDMFYDEAYTANSLLYAVHYRTAVCHGYSILEHALLKELGIQAYYIAGLIPVSVYETDLSFYSDEAKYELAGHAWLMAHDEQGVWYGWDPVQIDLYITDETGTWVDNVYGKELNFWKNPYEDDPYSYQDYTNGIYDSFNYNFAARRVVTSRIGYNDYLAQKTTEPTEFNVSFETNGAGEIPTQVVAKGDKVEMPTEPAKDGFEFSGWFEDVEFSKVFHSEKMILKDMTLYAKWIEKPYDPTPEYYYVIEGQGQSYYRENTSDELVFRVSGELDNFQGLTVDDEEVGRGFYELSEGSTIVTLKSELIELLSDGIHTAKFIYTNGEAEAVFRVAGRDAESRTKIPDEVLHRCIVESYEYFYGLSPTVEDELTDEEIANIKYFTCMMPDEEIADLTGIELLTGVTSIMIMPTKITASNVDFSKNTMITSLTLGELGVDALDLSANTELKRVNVAFAKNLGKVILASENKINALNITSDEVWDDDGEVFEGELTVSLNPEAELEKLNEEEFALSLDSFSFLLGSSTASQSGAPIENEEFIIGDTECYKMSDGKIIIKTTCLANGLSEVKIEHNYDILSQRFTNKFNLEFKNPLEEEAKTPNTGFFNIAGGGARAIIGYTAGVVALIALGWRVRKFWRRYGFINA